jgi:hypothetical protein
MSWQKRRLDTFSSSMDEFIKWTDGDRSVELCADYMIAGFYKVRVNWMLGIPEGTELHRENAPARYSGQFEIMDIAQIININDPYEYDDLSFSEYEWRVHGLHIYLPRRNVNIYDLARQYVLCPYASDQILTVGRALGIINEDGARAFELLTF